MKLIDIFLMFCVDFHYVKLVTGKPDPPRDIKVEVIANTAKITWIIPSNQGVMFSRIFLNNSKEGDMYLDQVGKFKDIPVQSSTFEIANLKMCSEYDVRIQFISRSGLSDYTTQKFWMSDNSFTADINENIELSWTTSMTDYFVVMSPKFNIIYLVQGNYIISNSIMKKYIYDQMSMNVSAIKITVNRVNKADAGLYISRANSVEDMVDGCCLFIVTSKPINTTVTLQPEHPFVGDNITFTCFSTIQRWPEEYRTSYLSYQFNGNTRGATDYNKLQMNKLTKSDKGTTIKCQATDDLGKSSNMSNTVTLDPYYGPDHLIVEPAIPIINVTEGTAFGPIYCIATCNPPCIYNWKQKWTGGFNPVPNEYITSQGWGVKVPAIHRSQNGTYRCRVDHSTGYVHKTQDISVNVQYSPQITDIWFSSDNQRYGLRTPGTFIFNEEENVKMTLRVESNPDPQIIFKSSLFKMQPIKMGNGYTDYTSNLPTLKCVDSGNFSIQASNGIPYADTRMVTLEIRCKPRNATAESDTVGAKVGSVENIVLHVISFPAPNVRWVLVTGFTWKIEKDRYDYRHKIHSKIHIRSEEDFGVYGIRICNQLGCIVENITLKPQDKPDAPQNFSVETKTFRSVNLSWIAGFNGGLEQTFTVQFKTIDNDKWKVKNVQINDIRTGSKIYYPLDQLRPDTSYQVTVVSKNLQGQRNTSLEFKTEEPTTDSVRWNLTSATERHDVSCLSDSISVFIPSDLLSHYQTTWRDPHCQVQDNGTHYVSTISHTSCGTTVIFTKDEVIFENELILHKSGSPSNQTSKDSIDFGSSSSEVIPVQCIYPRRQNITTLYRPAQSKVRFYEKRYGHMDVQLEQYRSGMFVTPLPVRSFPNEVEINKDMYFILHAMHVNSTDVAVKVDSCVATPTNMPADGRIYQLLDQGCPASPAVKVYPSSFDEVRFSVRAFEFRTSPGGIVYIHCQVSVCSPTSPQCRVGCAHRHRREVSTEDGGSHLVSGGPYLLVADKDGLQVSTVVAGVCASVAVVATVIAIIGWRRKSSASTSSSKL